MFGLNIRILNVLESGPMSTASVTDVRPSSDVSKTMYLQKHWMTEHQYEQQSRTG